MCDEKSQARFCGGVTASKEARTLPDAMAITERDETYLMDLTVLLKALREAREEAAQAVQRATTTLQQEQARTSERMGAETRRQQEALTQQWQQVVRQAARVQRWLPWKVALLLLGGTLLVNAGGTAWWSWHQAADLQALRTHKQLAVGLTHYLANTLYPQLSKAQQRDVDALFKEAGFAPLGSPRR